MAPLRVSRRCGGLLAVWAKRTPPELGSGRRFTMVRSMWRSRWRSRWRARDRRVLRPGQLPCPRCGLRESGRGVDGRWRHGRRSGLAVHVGRVAQPGVPPRRAWRSGGAWSPAGQDRGLPSGSPAHARLLVRHLDPRAPPADARSSAPGSAGEQRRRWQAHGRGQRGAGYERGERGAGGGQNRGEDCPNRIMFK